MTVILAIEHPSTGEIAIGSDGRCMAGGTIVSERTEKVIHFGQVASIGTNGLSASIDLLRAAADAFSPEVMTTMRQVLRLLRDAFVADGWKPQQNDKEPGSYHDGFVLAWWAGPERGVYDVDGMFSLTRIEPGLPAARGSGDCEAVGAALGLIDARGYDWTPRHVVSSAIRITHRIQSGVGPWHAVTYALPGEEPLRLLEIFP